MRGFTLIELLVATALALAVLAVALQVSASARVSASRDTEAADLAQRLRTGADILERAVRSAGVPVDLWTPENAAAPIPALVPLTSLGGRGSAGAGFAAVRLITAGHGRARLRAPAATFGPLRLQAPPSCPSTSLCGFIVGDTVLVLDEAGVSDVAQVAALDAGDWSLVTARNRAFPYAAGALVLAVEIATYGLASGSSGAPSLMKTTAAGARMPVLDHIAAFGVRAFGLSTLPFVATGAAAAPAYGPRPPPAGVDDLRDLWPPGENCTVSLSPTGAPQPRLAALGSPGALVELTPAMLADGPWCSGEAGDGGFDADLLRIRRVDLTIRAEAASPRARGPAGNLFARTGSGREASGWVPDGVVQLSIAVRGASP